MQTAETVKRRSVLRQVWFCPGLHLRPTVVALGLGLLAGNLIRPGDGFESYRQ